MFPKLPFKLPKAKLSAMNCPTTTVAEALFAKAKFAKATCAKAKFAKV